MVKFLVFLTALLGFTTSSTIITQTLKSALVKQPFVNIFITLNDSPLHAIRNITHETIPDRSTRLKTLYTTLVTHAWQTQAPIVSFLTSFANKVNFTPFWITNQIYIKNAKSSLVHTLARKFIKIVSSIDTEYFATVHSWTTNTTRATRTNQWGLEKIRALSAWKALGGSENAGKGVIVGVIDGGARYTHKILKNNFVGRYGWYDAISKQQAPYDLNGHGTHVTGVIVGADGYGVAPKAKWMSCRACDKDNSCAEPDLLTCSEFMFCPTLTDGAKADCSKAPHVISNSWGFSSGDSFDKVIQIWRKGGIIPVFAVGNSGPKCGSVGYPGSHQKVIGVGSTTSADKVASFSSRGPTLYKAFKPDISAPGYEIKSASHKGDSEFTVKHGSSMAAAHVAGAVALVLSKDVKLSYLKVRTLLLKNADKPSYSNGSVCGSQEGYFYPNNAYGFGRLNAYESIRGYSIYEG